MAVQNINGKIAGYEITGLQDGQANLFGEVHQTKFVELKEVKEEENL